MGRRPQPFDILTETASLMAAWRRVRANRGAAGIDQVTLAQFEAELLANLESLSSRLREGRYYPMPVRTVEMRKPSGGTRTLGILTVEDRIAQRAALDVIEPLFESAFLDCSFGFRPNRSVEMAVERVLTYRAEGNSYVVDADIADCFGSLDHDILMRLVGARVKDKRMLALIRMWLDTGQALPKSSHGQTSISSALLDRALGYVNNSFDDAITGLLDERGHGAYGYGGFSDCGPALYGGAAGSAEGPQQDAAGEAHRLARKEALKRLGRDGALLLLTYTSRVRHLLSPRALALTGAAALATAAYPLASRVVRGRLSGRGAGAVQGGTISPLLSNIYMHEFDVAMTGAGLKLVRYADDFVILCTDEQRAREAMELAARRLGQLRLRLNPEKTRIARFEEGLEFLGYRFDRQQVTARPIPSSGNVVLNSWLRNAPAVLDHARAKIAPTVSKFGHGTTRRAKDGFNRVISKLGRWRRKTEDGRR